MKIVNWMGYKWKSIKPDGGPFHPDNPHMWYDDSCVHVLTSGILALDAKYNPRQFLIDGKVYNPEIAIGLVSSTNAFSFGKFEACIRLPHGAWLWPAFWVSGAKTWPPEVDIFEGYSDKNSSYRNFQWKRPCTKYAVKTNGWKNVYPNQKQFGQQQHKAFKDPDSYHYFTMIWKPKEIKILFDSKEVRKFTDKKMLSQMADQGMRVLLNNGCRNDAKDLKAGYASSSMFVKSFVYTPG